MSPTVVWQIPEELFAHAVDLRYALSDAQHHGDAGRFQEILDQLRSVPNCPYPIEDPDTIVEMESIRTVRSIVPISYNGASPGKLDLLGN